MFIYGLLLVLKVAVPSNVVSLVSRHAMTSNHKVGIAADAICKCESYVLVLGSEFTFSCRTHAWHKVAALYVVYSNMCDGQNLQLHCTTAVTHV